MSVSGGTGGGVQQIAAADTTILVTGTDTAVEIAAHVGTTAGTVAAGNDTRFTEINGVQVTGVPAAGQVPTATGPSAATWQTPAAGGGGGLPSGGATGDILGYNAGGPVWQPPSVDTAQITDATTTGAAVLTAASAAAARTAIGAGTSNLTLGTAADTALAGNTTAAAIGGLQLGTTAATALAGNTTAAQIGGVDNTGPVPILHLWSGTQAQYTALATKDPNTLYVING